MAKSLQQFREWALKAGSTGNPSGGSYHGECVSLIQQYINQVFGMPYVPRGHAAWYSLPSSHFKQLPGNTKLKPGDIVRYGTNYGWGYGHIGMIDDRGIYLDQNGVRSRAIGTRLSPFADVRAVFRPVKKFNVKTPSKKKSIETVAKEIVAGKGGWGNGIIRVARLKAAGYNPSTVQSVVNRLIAQKNKPKAKYYTVRRGDTMSSIAVKHKTSLSNLAKLNPKIKNLNRISVGLKVRVK